MQPEAAHATIGVNGHTHVVYGAEVVKLGGDQPGAIGGGTGPATKFYGSYVVDGSRWIGFDDFALQEAKAEYALTNDMAGVMWWSLPGDVSLSTTRQGQTGPADYPDKSLVHHVSNYLQQMAPHP